MMYEELAGSQRRVRHVQGIHIKNLTPFPIRDHASSALQSTLAPILHLSDDTDLILARRRGRRVSQNSVVTLRTLRSEPHSEEGHEKPDSPRTARNRPTGPPVSYPRAGPSSPPAHMRRQRSISRVSLGSTQTGTHSRDLSLSTQPTSPPVGSSSFFYDASQRNLEKLMSSRLVETFVTLSAPEIGAPRASALVKDKLPSSPVAERSPVRGSPTKRFPGPNKASTAKHASRLSVGSNLIDGTGEQNNPKSSHGVTKRVVSAHKSTGSMANGSSKPSMTSSVKPIVFPGAPSPPPTRPASPALSTTEEHSPTIPFFLSPIHRPSTNPCWTDLDSGGDFAEWADRQQSRVIVTLWGRVDESSALAWSNLKGKAKSADPEETNDENWKVLYEWDVHMDRLEKVEAGVLDHFNVLPSNTLLLSLAPAGDLYFLPVNSSSHSPSPTAYASDSELASSSHKSKPPTRSEILQQSRRETRMKRSATWADLVKLSNLYAVVRDTQTSLDEVVHNTNNLIEQVGPNVLAREVSEREENIKSLRQEILAAQNRCTTAVQDIHSRIDQLRARREALQSAFDIYDQDVQSAAERSEQVNSARATYLAIHTALTPRRTTLCHTLDSIFPIEPDSERAADLVFTILDVPLPVPVAPSDPAPPLDNEEAVSAALGYAAHVVALLSSYMNARVPYPVTYVGSRSYVRDPISAMHGPRMFPLYPTGVDTYRFEYAVFLLNKDIETLMAEQGLRAADLRHTLPNLKNLILTLTHGSELTPPIIRVARALAVPETPEDTSTTPRAVSPVPSENVPAPAASRSRFLSPFTALLRPIYTGTSARPKVLVEVAEPQEGEGITPTDAETPLTARPGSSPNDSLGDGGNSSTSEQEIQQTEPKDTTAPPNGHEKLSSAPPSGTPPAASPLSHTIS